MKTVYLTICGLLAAAAVAAQTTPSTTVQYYTGLTISGTIGDSYTIQTTTGTGSSASWRTLAVIVLSNSPYLWIDTTEAASSARYYRVNPTTTASPAAPSGMALVPAASFVMGDSLDGENDAPVNTEYVSAFFMDTTLVSYSLWQQVYQWAYYHGYSFNNAGASRSANTPVQSISWYDCVKWCNARSQMSGATPVYYTDAGLTQVYRTGIAVPYVNWTASGYRLPTEAEFEKAARGGLAGKRYPLGNTISESEANYYGDPVDFSYDLGPAGYNPAFGNGLGTDTSPVNYFSPNGYGLCDMAGNLSEWCWDWYGSYANGVQTDPHGPTAGTFRVLRGGSWLFNAYECRVANRSYYYPALGGDSYGFRCVLAP